MSKKQETIGRFPVEAHDFSRGSMSQTLKTKLDYQMQKITIVFTTLIIAFVYVILANFAASVLIEDINMNTENFYKTGNPNVVRVGFSESVSVSVTKPRFYGTIYETGKISNLDFFNLFNIPIKVNGTNWSYAHLIALMSLIIFIKIKFKEEKKWSNSGDTYPCGEEQLSYSQYPM